MEVPDGMKALKKGILKRVSHDDVHDHSAAVSVSEGGDCFYDAPEARFCGISSLPNSSTYWEVNLHQFVAEQSPELMVMNLKLSKYKTISTVATSTPRRQCCTRTHMRRAASASRTRSC